MRWIQLSVLVAVSLFFSCPVYANLEFEAIEGRQNSTFLQKPNPTRAESASQSPGHAGSPALVRREIDFGALRDNPNTFKTASITADAPQTSDEAPAEASSASMFAHSAGASAHSTADASQTSDNASSADVSPDLPTERVKRVESSAASASKMTDGAADGASESTGTIVSRTAAAAANITVAINVQTEPKAVTPSAPVNAESSVSDQPGKDAAKAAAKSMVEAERTIADLKKKTEKAKKLLKNKRKDFERTTEAIRIEYPPLPSDEVRTMI